MKGSSYVVGAMRRGSSALAALAAVLSLMPAAQAQIPTREEYRFLPDKSVARNWSEALIAALRRDAGMVAVNARNVFHFSVAVYDAWAAYDDEAQTYLLGHTVGGFECPFSSMAGLPHSKEAREVSISYAAYRLLRHRFEHSVGAEGSFAIFDELMAHYGLDTSDVSTDYAHDHSAASLGNYVADCVIRFGLNDGSHEASGYRALYYHPANPPLDPLASDSIASIVDADRWQKLDLPVFVTKTGDAIDPPDFETPEWGKVVPFALTPADRTEYERDGTTYWVYKDPGAPPSISMDGSHESPDEYIWGHSLVGIWTGHLDPTRGHGAQVIDISPASIGNNPPLPETMAGLHDYYDLLNGGDSSRGHELNPATGQPYEPQYVPLGDYSRVLLQYWADGPFTGETPAGFMMGLLNREVSDAPGFEKRLGGTGPILDDLEWDVKAYFAVSAATHDAGVAAWSVKGWYDSVRPISAIRYMAMMGQSSDPADPDCHYDPRGLKYVDDPSDPAGDGSMRVIDCIRAGDPLAAGGANVGKIKFFTWRGPAVISNASFDVAGVDWIVAEDWWPMMRPDFVTPPFAGYVSGHSTVTRAGAEALTRLTGNPFFPDGMYEYQTKTNEFLVYEDGPTVDVNLQWATYYDVSDAAGISRIWGGVHPPIDDMVGRRIGSEVGIAAYQKAVTYFSGKSHQGE